MTKGNGSPAFRYYAFISYSHQDKAWADWLHKALEAYVVPKRLVGQPTSAGLIPRRLTPIFRDREELASGDDLGRKVNEALAQSANLIVICSPHAAASRWVDAEVLAYKRLGRAARIFCLIVGGEPNACTQAGSAGEECFAHALRVQLDAQGQPGTVPAEPIAADARPGADTRENVKLRLIAGLLDVDFDTLKQRQLHRRNRRLAFVAAGSLALTAITSMLAVAALFSRHDAEIARVDAERRQKQAEDLVGFMLGDLNDKLEQVSRLDILEAVDNKAMAYFQSLPTADVTDDALAQRAKALEKIGSVRLDQGNLAAALAAFRASAGLSSHLANAAPRDAARQTAYARTLSYIGMADWYQGDLDDAQQMFESSQHVLHRAQSDAPRDLEVKFELQTASSNLGHVLEARGQPAAAAAAYRDTLVLARQLAAADPGNMDWMTALGDAHNNLGKLALQRGDLVQAIAEYQADDSIETQLSSVHPTDNPQRENMLRVRVIVGRTLALAGELDAGMRDLQQAVDVADQLVRVDPGQSSFQGKLAISLVQLSRLKRLHGELPTAQRMTARAVRVALAQTRQNPDNTSWQQLAAEAQIEQAAQSLAGGQTGLARRQVQGARRILGPLFAKQPDDRGLLLDTLTANLLLAEASATAPAAQALREEAAEAAQATKSSRDDPRLLALQVEALLGLGNESAALPVIQRLWDTGYRDPALLARLGQAKVAYPPNLVFQARLQAAIASRSGAPGSSSQTGETSQQTK